MTRKSQMHDLKKKQQSLTSTWDKVVVIILWKRFSAANVFTKTMCCSPLQQQRMIAPCDVTYELRHGTRWDKVVEVQDIHVQVNTWELKRFRWKIENSAN